MPSVIKRPIPTDSEATQKRLRVTQRIEFAPDCELSDDLLAPVVDYQDAKKWPRDPTTTSWLRRHGGESGVYVVQPHRSYGHAVDDVFKYGRCDRLSSRFQDYRGAMTILFFVPTRFPRAVEALVRYATKRFVVHGNETVQLPLVGLIDVCLVAQRKALAMWGGEPPPDVRKASDRALRDYVKKQLALRNVEASATCHKLPEDAEERVRPPLQPFGTFVEECCVKDVTAKEYSAVLYQSYQWWCQRNGERYKSIKWFGSQMTMLFGPTHSLRLNKLPCAKAYVGVQLDPAAPDEGS